MNPVNFFYIVTSVLFICAATYFRIVDGAAPWYIVFPAIFSVFILAVVFSSIAAERKRGCRTR